MLIQDLTSQRVFHTIARPLARSSVSGFDCDAADYNVVICIFMIEKAY